jgi:hypothetical protein
MLHLARWVKQKKENKMKAWKSYCSDSPKRIRLYDFPGASQKLYNKRDSQGNGSADGHLPDLMAEARDSHGLLNKQLPQSESSSETCTSSSAFLAAARRCSFSISRAESMSSMVGGGLILAHELPLATLRVGERLPGWPYALLLKPLGRPPDVPALEDTTLGEDLAPLDVLVPLEVPALMVREESPEVGAPWLEPALEGCVPA